MVILSNHVESAIFVGHGAGGNHHERFRRKREPRDVGVSKKFALVIECPPGIPACAGMTIQMLLLSLLPILSQIVGALPSLYRNYLNNSG